MARNIVAGESPREPAWAVSDVSYYGIGQRKRRHAKGTKEPDVFPRYCFRYCYCRPESTAFKENPVLFSQVRA